MNPEYAPEHLYDDAIAAGFMPDDEPPDYGEAQPSAKPNKVRFTFSGGMDLFKPTPIDWLIKNILEAETISVLFGASGSGKTFAILDMALCVATGTPWHGHKVKQGKVVYVCGEGKAGIRRRVTAWAQQNGHHAVIAENFKIVDQVPKLPDDTADFARAIQSISGLRWVILDTLQRTFTRDPNNEMRLYVNSMDAINRAVKGLSTTVVHHTGHAEGSRERGGSELRASMDVSIQVLQRSDGVRGVESRKAKEAEEFPPMSFNLESVTLDGWQDDDGQPVTSAVLKHLEDHQQAQQPRRGKVSGKNQLAALAILRALQTHSVTNLKDGEYPEHQARVRRFEWQEQCIKESIARRQSAFMDRIQLPLVTAGAINLDGEYVVPVDFE